MKFYQQRSIQALRRITCVGLLSIVIALSTQAQELRLGMHTQVLGAVNGAFVGPTLGLEGSINDHMAVSVDFSKGFSTIGRLNVTQPGISYYFKEGRRGLFVGLHMKYMRLKERSDLDLYDNRLYAGGFSLGVKGSIGKKTDLLTYLSPHTSRRGRNQSEVLGMSLFVGISHRLGKK